jgi:hypothetical protein
MSEGASMRDIEESCNYAIVPTKYDARRMYILSLYEGIKRFLGRSRLRILAILCGGMSSMAAAQADPGVQTTPLELAISSQPIAIAHSATVEPSLTAAESELLAGVLALSGNNVCFAYAYDHNSNRTSLSAVTYSQLGSWGSSTFGCFSWSQP